MCIKGCAHGEAAATMICTLDSRQSECDIIHSNQRKGFVSWAAAEWIAPLEAPRGNEGRDGERNGEIAVIWGGG